MDAAEKLDNKDLKRVELRSVPSDLSGFQKTLTDPEKKKRDRVLKRMRESRDFDEISRMVKDGYSIVFIADYIHNNLCIFRDLTANQIEKALKKYRSNLPPAEVAEHMFPRRYLEKMREFEEGISVLNEMSEIYRLQKKRVGIVSEHEEKLGMLFPTTVREIDQCLTILKTIAEYQVALGIRDGSSKIIDVDTKTMAMLDGSMSSRAARRILKMPESRKKVLEIANNIASLRPDLQDQLISKGDNGSGNGKGNGSK
jgi:hypothetical protein